MNRRQTTVVVAIVGVLLGLSPALVRPAPAIDPATEGCGRLSGDDTGAWRSLTTTYPSGEPQVNTAFAVARSDHRVMAVTNGSTVLRTTDRGCTWAKVWPTPGAPAAGRVGGVAVASAGAVPHIHLRIVDGTAAIRTIEESTAVVSSHDGGQTWWLATEPISGPIQQLRASPSDPLTLSAVVGAPLSPAVMWSSTDGGRRWTATTSTASEDTDPESTVLSYDLKSTPGDGSGGETISLFGCRRAYVSDDHGRTHAPLTLPVVPDARLQEAATAAPRSARSSVIAIAAMRSYCTGASMAYIFRSENGGATWRVGELGRIIDGPSGRNYQAFDLDRDGGLTVVVIARGDAWLVDRDAVHEPLTLPEPGRALDVVGLDDVRRSFAILTQSSIALFESKRSSLGAGASVDVDFGDGSQRADATVCEGDAGAVTSSKGWTVAPRPTFPSPSLPRATLAEPVGQELTDFAVDVARPNRLYATNGLTVLRSEDGGCRWSTVYQLAGAAAATASVREIVTPTERAPGRVHLVVVDDTGGVEDRLEVLTSDDAGATWHTTRPFVVGEPGPRCTPTSGCRLAVAPSDPDRLYLVLATPVWLFGGPDVLYVSEDAGRTWQQRSYPYDLVTGQSCCDHAGDLAIDPADADRLWLTIEGEGLFSSTDAAHTWMAVAEVENLRSNALALLDAAPNGRSTPTVTTFDPSGAGSAHVQIASQDGGVTWHASTARGLGTGPRSIAHGSLADETVVAAHEGVFAYAAHADLWVDVNVLELNDLDDIQASRTEPASYFLRNTEVIAWFTPDLLPTLSVPLRPEPDFSLPPLLEADPAVMVPPFMRVDLDEDETKATAHRLDLPAQPTPLDVFFLLDASGSMGDDHRALARQLETIVRELSAARIPVAFGLGTYRDLDERYRRLHDISPPSAALVRKMHAIRAAGGAEPAYTALRQMASGTGIAIPLTGAPVPPGQQASFRPNARRYVVHVTDEPLQPDPPHGDPLTAVLDLQARSVGHIGLIATPPSDLPDADAATIDPQMRALSAATGAVAPAGGVDCDGDGRADLQRGEPIVCRIPTDEGRPDLATPLVEILLSLEDRQRLQVVASHPELVSDVVVGPPGDIELDVTKRHAVPISAVARCPSERVGTETTVRLSASLGGNTVAEATVVVACAFEGLPAAGLAVGPPPPGSAAALALAVPAIPPPVVVPAAGPANATSSSSSSASAGASAGAVAAQPGAAAGAADDDEEAQQTSTASAGQQGPDVMHATAGRRERPISLVTSGAAMLLLASAAVVRRRDRAPARARVRR